jgi:hypothetical protein
MANYTIEYTDTEDLAMHWAALSADEWIQNAAHERARIAIEEIVQIAVQQFLAVGQSIPGTREEIVAAAFANGWVKSAADRNAEVANTPG